MRFTRCLERVLEQMAQLAEHFGCALGFVYFAHLVRLVFERLLESVRVEHGDGLAEVIFGEARVRNVDVL